MALVPKSLAKFGRLMLQVGMVVEGAQVVMLVHSKVDQGTIRSWTEAEARQVARSVGKVGVNVVTLAPYGKVARLVLLPAEARLLGLVEEAGAKAIMLLLPMTEDSVPASE